MRPVPPWGLDAGPVRQVAVAGESGDALSASCIYAMLKRFFVRAAATAGEAGLVASRFEAAATHWMRWPSLVFFHASGLATDTSSDDIRLFAGVEVKMTQNCWVGDAHIGSNTLAVLTGLILGVSALGASAQGWGEMCSTGAPGTRKPDWAKQPAATLDIANSRCESRQCRPGPQENDKENGPWYCTDKAHTYKCVVPGHEGAEWGMSGCRGTPPHDIVYVCDANKDRTLSYFRPVDSGTTRCPALKPIHLCGQGDTDARGNVLPGHDCVTHTTLSQARGERPNMWTLPSQDYRGPN